jgi:hypothetical protein
MAIIETDLVALIGNVAVSTERLARLIPGGRELFIPDPLVDDEGRWFNTAG